MALLNAILLAVPLTACDGPSRISGINSRSDWTSNSSPGTFDVVRLQDGHVHSTWWHAAWYQGHQGNIVHTTMHVVQALLKHNTRLV